MILHKHVVCEVGKLCYFLSTYTDAEHGQARPWWLVLGGCKGMFLPQVKLGDINVVLPCANSMSVAQPAKVGALIVRLSECAVGSAAGV